MNKLCCCADPELPVISVNVACACCKSNVEEHDVMDSPPLPPPNDDDGLDKKGCRDLFCCCIHRKRHAKSKKRKNHSQDGSKTEGNLL